MVTTDEMQRLLGDSRRSLDNARYSGTDDLEVVHIRHALDDVLTVLEWMVKERQASELVARLDSEEKARDLEKYRIRRECPDCTDAQPCERARRLLSGEGS